MCRLPRPFDQKLAERVRQILFLSIILHLGKAIWVYGNPAIFGDTVTQFLEKNLFNPFKDAFDYGATLLREVSKNTPGLVRTFFDRTVRKHNISLTVVLVIILLALIAR